MDADARAMLAAYVARLRAEDGPATEPPVVRRPRIPIGAYGDGPSLRPGPQPENAPAVRAPAPDAGAAAATAKLAEAVERLRQECWALATIASELDQRVEQLEGRTDGAIAPGHPQPPAATESGPGEPGYGWG